MATIAYQQVNNSGGTTVTYGAVTAADKVAPNERGWMEVVNASGASINWTVVVPGTKFGQALADVVIAVPAGARRHYGPMSRELAGTDGMIDTLFSAQTSVTAAALQI